MRGQPSKSSELGWIELKISLGLRSEWKYKNGNTYTYFLVSQTNHVVYYTTQIFLGNLFFVYIHEVHSCFQKSHQHRKWNPRVPCICTCSSPKMSQKTTCDVKRVHLLLYVIHAVTPFWPMYYIILSFLCSCLKKASVSSSSSWFWFLTFDSKRYSAFFA